MDDVQRYKLLVAYRGTRYHGWQVQVTPPTWKGEPAREGGGLPTVQETLERALAVVVGHPVASLGSSRTDAGVHARGQVVHFDTSATQIPSEGLRRATNARLPDDILIRSIDPVPIDFDAVGWTVSKRYEYLIHTAADRTVFGADLSWHRWQALDVDAMRQAAGTLVGTHDFASFCKPGHGREHTVRTVTRVDVSADGDRLTLGVEGTGFLWQMVRIMVGTLVEVGTGRTEPSAVARMLAARDRRAAGPTAPPHGLYLDRVTLRPIPPSVPTETA
jgi:tRNA pseudouridine38-40 synthase